VRGLVKSRVAELQVGERVKGVLLRVLGPDEEVYVEVLEGKRVRVIL
jgi:hypothetical protein